MQIQSKKAVKRLLTLIPAALFIIVVLLSINTAWYFAHHITDSDAASDLVQGKLLADQNKIITKDWSNSSEIKFFHNNIVYMFLFKLFNDWQFIRFISILIFQAMLIGSYFYFSRQARMSTHAFFISASLMLMPLSDVYGRITLFQNYYIYLFVYGFLITGLFLSFLQHKGQSRIRQSLRLAAMLLLTLMNSMNGIRQIPSTLVPLLLTVLLLQIKNHDHPEIPAASKWKSVGLAGLLCFIGLAGSAFYMLFLQPLYCGAEAASAPFLTMLPIDNIRSLFVEYLGLFGYIEGVRLFSINGLVSLCSVFAAAMIMIFSISTLFQKYESLESSLASAMYPIAMILMTIIFVFVSGYEIYSRYYLQTFIWVFPFLGMLLTRSKFTLRTVTFKQIVLALVCICMGISGLYGHIYYHDSENRMPNSTIGLNMDIYCVNRLQPVVDFLEQDEYEVGYATHWNANIVTEMTDGRIPMITIVRNYPEFIYTYRDWLTNKQYRELSFVEDKYIFMLLSQEEADVFSGSELSAFAIPVYEDEHYIVFTFDFSTEVWDYLLEQAKAVNQSSVLSQLLPEGE